MPDAGEPIQCVRPIPGAHTIPDAVAMHEMHMAHPEQYLVCIVLQPCHDPSRVCIPGAVQLDPYHMHIPHGVTVIFKYARSRNNPPPHSVSEKHKFHYYMQMPWVEYPACLQASIPNLE